MTESGFISIFHMADVAEVNSLSLFDYETSLNNYFNSNNSPTFCQQYFKWFDHSKFDTTINKYLNDFDKWFHDFF